MATLPRTPYEPPGRTCSSRRARVSTGTSFTTFSARRRPACTRSAAWAPSAGCRTSTTWCSSARRCRAIRSRATARSARPRRCWARASPSEPIELDMPITIAGMSFGALSANVQGGARPRGHRDGHLDHHGRRRHDAPRSGSRPRRWSTSVCRRATASIPTICARPMPSKWSSARAPSPAAAACCWVRKSVPRVAAMRTLARGHRSALGLPPSGLDRPR